MSIKNHLVLDHFYIDLEDGEFQFLTKMGSILKNCVHSVVKTDSDHWEGIHLMSRTQSYFEILREYTNGMFGLCLSPMRIQYADARTIQSEEPGPWFTGHRNSSDGQPWFDWMSREDIMKPDSFVAIWAMQYH
ncbi:MAG TPA: hypothetical protein VM432_12845, partial [Bdellovibrionales bacterium]|nr:hypothetical protein [Bdellovibrionales bacterium]